MARIGLSAGHGGRNSTAGKRTPDGEYEWNFNDAVVRAAIDCLSDYEDVEILRVDDATGKTDVPLKTRTSRLNAWKADVYVSVHHNANNGKWGAHTGVETYVYSAESTKAVALAKAVHPRLVGAMGTKDRGIKYANFHDLRESNCPSILTEGGYMDSTIDIVKMRDSEVLRKAGEAIAIGIVSYLGLKRKATEKVTQVSSPLPKKSKQTNGAYRIKTGAFANARSLAEAIDKVNADFGWLLYEAADATTFNPTYRIYTGVFNTKEVAEDARKQITAKYGWLTYLIDESK